MKVLVTFQIRLSRRGPGDLAELAADSTRLRREFDWHPRYSDLETIIVSAYKWHQCHPRGYADR